MSPCSARAAQEQTIIWRDGDEVCIRIARRKNRPNGSGTLRRKCTCSGGASSCAVHTLWDQYFAKLDDGAKPWAHITAGKARERLRQVLCRLQVPDADKYGTQDFRRGHAEAPVCLTNGLCMLLVLLSITGHQAIRMHISGNPHRRAVEIHCILKIPRRGYAVQRTNTLVLTYARHLSGGPRKGDSICCRHRER